jgi:hypothetical protein
MVDRESRRKKPVFGECGTYDRIIRHSLSLLSSMTNSTFIP